MFLAIEAVLFVTDENLWKNTFNKGRFQLRRDGGWNGMIVIKSKLWCLITRWYRQEAQIPRMCWDSD